MTLLQLGDIFWSAVVFSLSYNFFLGDFRVVFSFLVTFWARAFDWVGLCAPRDHTGGVSALGTTFKSKRGLKK